MSSPADQFIRWFDDIRIQDIPAVGGKNASLGELRRMLGVSAIDVPNGFAATVNAYRSFLESNYLDEQIRASSPGSIRATSKIFSSVGARSSRQSCSARCPRRSKRRF